MKFEIKFIILMFGLAILAGCQTLSKEECVAADWRVVGEQDGAAGHPPQQRFGDHAKSCERAGIVPDQTLWNQGYQIGLTRFCTPLSGLAHGKNGKSYANNCPPELASAFNSGYLLGLKHHGKLQEMDSVRSQIRSYEYEISSTQKKISEGKIDQSEGEAEIRYNRRRINDLNRELGRRESDLFRINSEIEEFRRIQHLGPGNQNTLN